MEFMNSIYEIITANIQNDGTLPDDFMIQTKHEKFAPGAMDGILIYHTENLGTGGVPKDETAEKIVDLLKQYFKSENHQFINEIESILADESAISLVDLILSRLSAQQKDIDANSMVANTLNLLETSHDCELVKIGIALLGLFDFGGNEEIIEFIKTFAAYDEFTLYVVVAASGWTNGNVIIFEIVKKVNGWGKVHAVERLEPENDEIRDWILREGCLNGVLPAYLGLTCAEKGDLISALRQETLDDELFDGVSIIIEALLDEGPVAGISAYDHAAEALKLYLHHAEQIGKSNVNKDTVKEIKKLLSKYNK